MAEAARKLDAIDVRPAITQADVDALNARFAGVPTGTMLRELLTGELAGRTALVSSFGTESAVLLHLVSEIDRSIPLIFTNTQKRHTRMRHACKVSAQAQRGLTSKRAIGHHQEIQSRVRKRMQTPDAHPGFVVYTKRKGRSLLRRARDFDGDVLAPKRDSGRNGSDARNGR